MTKALAPMDVRQSLSDLAVELAGGEVSSKLDSIASSLEDIAVSLDRLAEAVDSPYRKPLWRRLLNL